MHQALLWLPIARTAIERIASFITSTSTDSTSEVLDILASGEINTLSLSRVDEMLKKIGEPKIGGDDEQEAEKEMDVVGEAFRARL